VYVLSKASGRSFPHIGRVFDDRDHPTVLHATCLIERWLTVGDEQIAGVVGANKTWLNTPSAEPPAIPLSTPSGWGKRGNWTDNDIAILARMYGDERRSAKETALALRRTLRGVVMKALALRIAAQKRRKHQTVSI
jgi:hypothetical protein